MKSIFYFLIASLIFFGCSEGGSSNSSSDDQTTASDDSSTTSTTTTNLSCSTYQSDNFTCFKLADSDNQTEFYLISTTNDYVLVVSDATYALWTADISQGDTGFYKDRRRLAKNLYSIFEDHFDFIIVFNQYDYETNLNLSARAGYSGINGSVSNSVSGIGLSKFSSASSYGSGGKLGSFIHMPLHYYVSSGPMLHAIFHQWGNYFFKYDSGHWGVSGVGGGQLGGFDPSTLMSKDNLTTGGYALTTGQYRAASSKYNSSFGTFANGGNSVPYSPFEKWLMGLIPPSEVPNFKIPIKSGVTYPQKGSNGLIEADSIAEVSLSDILSNPSQYDNDSTPKEYRIRSAAYTGPRNPDHTTSQKNFRALMVLVTTHTLMGKYKHDTFWNTDKNAWDTKPGTTKTIDAFQSSITKFAKNSGDNRSAYAEQKWQPVPAGAETTVISGKTYINQPDTNYNFWEATGGLATLQIDNLSESLKTSSSSRVIAWIKKQSGSPNLNEEALIRIQRDPFDDPSFYLSRSHFPSASIKQLNMTNGSFNY